MFASRQHELGIGNDGRLHLQRVEVCRTMEPEVCLLARNFGWHRMRYHGGEDDIRNCDEVREGDELRSQKE